MHSHLMYVVEATSSSGPTLSLQTYAEVEWDRASPSQFSLGDICLVEEVSYGNRWVPLPEPIHEWVAACIEADRKYIATQLRDSEDGVLYFSRPNGGRLSLDALPNP